MRDKKILKDQLPPKEKVIEITEKMIAYKWEVSFYYGEITNYDTNEEEPYFSMDIYIPEDKFPKEKLMEQLVEIDVSFNEIKISHEKEFVGEWRYIPARYNIEIEIETTTKKQPKKKSKKNTDKFSDEPFRILVGED